MRLYLLMLFCMALTTTWADPDPKKYKTEIKDKNKASNTTLTADEKKFLRDVEAKYGIKNDASKEETEDKPKGTPAVHVPFPAVIAIEIVNDTDTKTKGKRTIDANLGYGYKTNNGYTYSYFGKPAHEKGKFMIYPYSQEDIPPANTHSFKHYDHAGKPLKTSVEIQPSQAFELVAEKEERPTYNYEKPAIEFKTPTPQPASYSSTEHSSSSFSSHPSTLYTTYNGEQFTSLSGQFPSVKSNYLVDPSQLLQNPEYQNVGLTQDHLRTHGSHLEQKVVPVLVLRIPSSSLTNPTAELYANLPQNYPLSNYLNNVNLQELVNQYFKKAGYSFAPQVMAYHSSGLQSHGQLNNGHGASSVSQYEPQHYANPYVQPSYTQSHHSGVQYSAVQPVMARYPSSYVRQNYMSMLKGHSLYKQPSLPQKYEYQYQYVPQSAVSSQKYYMPSTHYQQQTSHANSGEARDAYHASLEQATGVYNANNQGHFESGAQVSGGGYETAVSPGGDYGASQGHAGAQYETTNTVAPEYGSPNEQHSGYESASAGYESASAGYETASAGYESASAGYQSASAGYESASAGYETAGTPASAYGADKDTAISQITHDYYSQIQQNQPETHSVYSSQTEQPISSHASQSDIGGQQNYVYQHQQQESDDHGITISENYPSKDHTIATVLPTHYKIGKQNSGMIQTVSYVTPMPYSSKYQLPYKVMVPQTFLHNPSTEKVSYVNSHPISSSYSQTIVHQEYNPEAEYTVGYHHTPPVGKQKAPSYPRNYHSHPKRMVKPENKSESGSSLSKNKSDRNEKKKSH